MLMEWDENLIASEIEMMTFANKMYTFWVENLEIRLFHIAMKIKQSSGWHNCKFIPEMIITHRIRNTKKKEILHKSGVSISESQSAEWFRFNSKLQSMNNK